MRKHAQLSLRFSPRSTIFCWLLLCLTCFFTACQKDDSNNEATELDLCAEVVCENDRECLNGVCKCGRWFSGDFCEDAKLGPNEGLYSGSYQSGTEKILKHFELTVNDGGASMVTDDGLKLSFEAWDKSKFSIKLQDYHFNGEDGKVWGSGELLQHFNLFFDLTFSKDGVNQTWHFVGHKIK